MFVPKYLLHPCDVERFLKNLSTLHVLKIRVTLTLGGRRTLSQLRKYYRVNATCRNNNIVSARQILSIVTVFA